MNVIMIMLATLLIGACAALPTTSEQYLQTEMTNKDLEPLQERAGQDDAQSSAVGEKGFLDELFEGVAEAVTSGALSPLADAAVKPLVSAVGSSVIEQIFSAANDIINEWKRSKHHNLEAHPVFIPDRGAFILVSADWIIPEQLTERTDQKQETTTAKTTTEYNENSNSQDITDVPDVIENVTNNDGIKSKPVEYDATEETINDENNASVSNDAIYPKDDQTSASIVLKDNLNVATLLSINDLDVKNITEELELNHADFEINNEIERRSIPVQENTESINEEEENLQETYNLNNRKGRLNRRFQNIADFKHWGHTFGRSARILNEIDVSEQSMPEVIRLKNVYLVPVPGEVDWTRGEEEFGAIQEALKAVMATKKVSERNHMRVEEFLANKLKKLADNLASS